MHVESQLYHITFHGRLRGIADVGLRPGRGSTFGGGYAGHARGWTFLCDEDAVSGWFGKLRDIAESESDDPVEEGWVPVVIRLDNDGEYLEVEDDELGNRDVIGGASYKTKEIVPPGDLEVWDGEEWIPLEEWESVDPELGVTRTIEEGEYDDEGEPVELIYLDDSRESALFPWDE